jgi:hypothetical protein
VSVFKQRQKAFNFVQVFGFHKLSLHGIWRQEKQMIKREVNKKGEVEEGGVHKLKAEQLNKT